jgi:aprataxin
MPSPPSSSTIPQLKILRAYAKLNDASLLTTTLPPTVYFSHTRHTLTIFDAYPKALFHLLVLPRLSPRIATTTTATTTSSSSRTPAPEDGDGDERREPDSEVESEVEVVVADRTEDLTSLRTLLLLLQRADPDSDARARVKGTLSVLSDESTRLQSQIEREMQTHYGFKWPIWIGFHAIPSMEYVPTLSLITAPFNF